jgi:ankyrin repeat protein
MSLFHRRPSIPVIKALITAYPEAIRSGCEEGYLPLHRYMYRPIVDLDALRLLINYFPDALLAKSNRNQTPLHVALDHHTPDALAVELLMEVCPAAVTVADSDRYLPLHLCLDCAEVTLQFTLPSFMVDALTILPLCHNNIQPNYALALQLLMAHPQAASFASKDGMLPLHLLVGANSDPTHEHSSHLSEQPAVDGSPNAGTVSALFCLCYACWYPDPQTLL